MQRVPKTTRLFQTLAADRIAASSKPHFPEALSRSIVYFTLSYILHAMQFYKSQEATLTGSQYVPYTKISQLISKRALAALYLLIIRMNHFSVKDIQAHVKRPLEAKNFVCGVMDDRTRPPTGTKVICSKLRNFISFKIASSIRYPRGTIELNSSGRIRGVYEQGEVK
jgi:hypothetical protein